MKASHDSGIKFSLPLHGAVRKFHTAAAAPCKGVRLLYFQCSLIFAVTVDASTPLPHHRYRLLAVVLLFKVVTFNLLFFFSSLISCTCSGCVTQVQRMAKD